MSIPLPYFAKALFEYKAVEDTELSIGKGDFMTVEEINDTGWCLAKHTDGRAGWLPVDYVEQVDSIPAEVGAPPAAAAEEVARTDEAMAGALKSLSASAAAEPTNNSSSNGGGAGVVVEMGGSTLGSSDSKVCHQCKQAIAGAFVVAKDWSFHPDCFTCATCKTALGGKPFIEKDDKFFCEEDYYASFNPKCGACDEVIKGQYISALNKSWHPEHFVCTTCKAPFEGSQFRKHDDRPYCEEHFSQLFATPCAKCGLNISGQVFQAMDKKYHLDCFVCAVGDHKIGESGNFHMHENKIYCPAHFDELVLNRCSGCKNLIRGPYIKIMDNFYHPDCWKCATCAVTLKADTCAQLKSVFYCKPCHAKARAAADAVPAAGAPIADPGEAAAKAALAKMQADKEAKARADAAEAARIEETKQKLEEEKKKGTFTYFEVPYDSLTTQDATKLPVGVDPSKKELYLSDAIFVAKFKMDKATFAKKPKWQQDNLKKELKLF